MAVAVVEEGEGGVALSEVEDERLGLAHANDRLGIFAVGFHLFYPKTRGGGEVVKESPMSGKKRKGANVNVCRYIPAAANCRC